MFTCPNCTQTINEKLFAKTDEKIKKENSEQYEKVVENTKLGIIKQEEYQKIVDEHNEKRTYSVSWFLEKTWSDKKWKLNVYPSIYIYTEDYEIVDGYPPVYLLTQNKLPFKYIECPLCDYKMYIK